MRRLKRRLQSARESGTRQDPEQRIATRLSYDAALICLGVGLGIPTPFRLGEVLSSAERDRLTAALSRAGLTLSD
jgi:hypothetical protein